MLWQFLVRSVEYAHFREAPRCCAHDRVTHMRTREKVIVLLIGATLFLGGLTFIIFRDNETEANYFRWLIANKLSYGLSSPLRFLSEELPPGTFFYSGLAIFAVVMTIVILKMIRDGEIQALRGRLLDLVSEKHQTESLLQEQVWRGKHDQEAKDLVMRDLEVSIQKIESLFSDLNEKETELRTREAELMALKSRATAESDAAQPSTPAERRLRDELKQKTEILRAQEIAIRDGEQRLSAKTRLWESQLREKDGLLNERDSALKNFRAEFSELQGRLHQAESAKKRAEDMLQGELRRRKEVLETDSVARKTEEKRLGERIRNLEGQLSERDKVLRQRDLEMNGLRKQFTELESAKAQVESHFQKELTHAEEELHEKVRVLREVEQRFDATRHDLRNEIAEKDMLLQVRDDELVSLKSEVKALSLRLSEMASAKVRAEEVLHEALNKEKQQLEAQRGAYRELENRHSTEIAFVTGQLDEREAFLKRRDGELRALEEKVEVISRLLSEATAAKEQTERSLGEELKKERVRLQSSAAAKRELEQSYGREVEVLKRRLGQEQESRQSRDEEINSLKTQVTSLSEQLAKIGPVEEHAAERGPVNDSAMREVEESFKARIHALEEQLTAKQEIVGSRNTEVAALNSELKSLQQRTAALAAAKERAESLFEEAVREKADLLQSNDAHVKKLEGDLTGKVRQLESQLLKKEELLNSRESELEGFKSQLRELAIEKDQTARLLQENLKQQSELLSQREAALNALEERSSNRIRGLENALSEKQDLLEARDSELRTLLSKVNSQAGQLVELQTLKDRAARSLEDELRRATESLQSKEAAMKAMDDRLSGRLRSLENQLSERQELLETRDGEVDALMSKVGELTHKLSEAAAERERTARLLQEELREKTVLLQSQESSIGELEIGFTGRVDALERQIAEKQKLLEASDAKLTEFRAQMETLRDRLEDAEAARLNLESLLQEQRGKTDQALMVLPSDGEGPEGVETLLSQREELLKARDKLIQNLMTELKDKKTQLARQEIDFWQKVERREAWKHRLSKIGIRLKD